MSELRRGWSVQVSTASVATATRVLDQPAEVGVMARAGAGRAPEIGAERVVAEEAVEQGAQVRVVDLAAEVLEEAVELLQVAVGDRQELGGVGRGLLGPRGSP